MTTILRQKPYASWFFGTQNPGHTMYAIPRYKYMYYASFQANAQAMSMYPDLFLLGGLGGVSFKIKGIDRPNIDLQQRELNQYNRKRYAYIKTEYKPVTITMYDTVDNRPLDMWVEYFTYYFGDARYKSSATMQSNPTDPTFDDSTGWGLRPMAEQVNFFTSVDLYAFGGKKEYTKVSYLNPKISAVDWGNNDSSSSDMEELKMTLSYETIQYDSGTITDQMALQFGFDIGKKTLEPPVSPALINNVKLGTGPHRYSNHPDSDNTTIATDITKPSASVLSNFGMSGSSYAALGASVPGAPGVNQSGSPLQTRQILGNQYQYSTGVGANDYAYSQQGVGGEYSDIPIPDNYGLGGYPDGQLPISNQFLPSNSIDLFVSTKGVGVYASLGAFGSFNFGSGQVQSTYGGSYTRSTDPITGETSYRPGVPDNLQIATALPPRYPGQRGPALRYNTLTPYNSRGGQRLTQIEQLQQARRRVQSGGIAIEVGLGQPEYTNYGIPTGYEQYGYQPGPESSFGPNLTLSAALSNNYIGISVQTTNNFGFGGVDYNNAGNFLPLYDPYIYGGDPSDNEPPQVVFPYDNYNE
jgi:hypothetical protein